MTWLQKLLGSGKREDTVLTLKLRLNRWRHFLRTGSDCLGLLADLREKCQGEYIFDRQYVFSTVGQIFHKAYQMAYDGMILRKNRETALYLWLDQMQEKTQALLAGFSGNRGIRKEIPPSGSLGPVTPQGGQETLKESEDLEQEPEFQMLQGILDLLDPSGPGGERPCPIKIEGAQDLRGALRWAHEQVMARLIHPEDLQHWLKTGPAVLIKDREDFSFYVIDLEEGSSRNHPPFSKTGQAGSDLPSYRPWSLFHHGFSAALEDRPKDRIKKGGPFFLFISENSLFLYNSSSEGAVFLDMVLTSVRDLNHFYFRWQAGLDDSSIIRALGERWEGTYRQDEKIFELAAFQRPPKEIEKFANQAGQALAFR
jgi:hypothetical protein